MTLTHLSRTPQALALVAVLVTLASPAVALSASSSGKTAPDWFERYAAAHPFGDAAAAPDVFERYAANHATAVLNDVRSPDTRDVASGAQLRIADQRSPDTRDVASGTQLRIIDQRSPDTRDVASGAQLRIIDQRSPDTRDAAASEQPAELAQPSSFDWGDASIGASAAAIILSLIAGSMLLLTRLHRRQQVQTT